MKILQTLSSLGLFLLISFSVSAQNWSNERSIKATAEAASSPASITIRWEVSPNASAYRVYRRDIGSSDWGSALVNLNATDSMYKDQAVTSNKLYEYKIEMTSTLTEPFSSSNAKLISYGFIASGIELEPKHERGNLMLFVTSLIQDSLPTELEILQQDLRGDGWNVLYQEVTASMNVEDVKSAIDNTTGIDAIFLLGQVPYPYSGNYCYNLDYETPPDGHHEDAGGHCGAWIADIYYGVKDGEWEDIDSVTNASRNANDNYPGDGKFDNNQIPGTVSIEIGRVDLSRLDSFDMTEVGLTKQYLEKLHDYKHNITIFKREAIIENNFSSFPEGFSSGAIRDFTAHLGSDKIINADLFNTTDNDNYLFSYTCGAGSYVSCAGVGRQEHFTNRNPAIFNHMFGSYFGDFDIKNNISRASLAAKRGGLTSIWSGRPKWVTHGLAMGEHIGTSTVRSQNNDWNYGLSFYQNYAHIALLGDPTLRTSMISPPSNINVSLNGAKNNVILDWTASTSQDVIGYYIYWSDTKDGDYTLLTQMPIPGTSYTHFTPVGGNNYYMVRAERLEKTKSGTYYNLSIGTFAEATGVQRTAGLRNVEEFLFSVYPMPAKDQLKIRSTQHEKVKLDIYDILGNLVQKDVEIYDGAKIDIAELVPGVYFLVGNTINTRFIKI